MPAIIPRSFSDFLWPRKCELCQRPSDRDGRFICSACMMRLPVVGQTGCCRVCARPVTAPAGEFLCEECRALPPAFDRAAAALRFQGVVREMLLDFKFNGHVWLRDDFADWLEAAIRVRFDVTQVDVVVPMPSTLFHRWDRGYNPCDYLGAPLAERLDRRFDVGALARCGHPRRQSDLAVAERRANVKGTFAVRHPERIRGRTVLVIDDILTTGATLSECATTLKAAGAHRVWCAALARAVFD